MSAWIDINLARPEDWRRRRLIRQAVGALTALLLLLALNFVRWQQLKSETQALESLQQVRTGKQAALPPFTPAQAQSSQAIRDMLVQLSTPWEGLFKDLEAATSEGVRVESLLPQPDKSQVLIKLAAQDFAGLIGFVNALNAQQTVSQARLISESYTSGAQTQRWQGVVQATWTRKPHE